MLEFDSLIEAFRHQVRSQGNRTAIIVQARTGIAESRGAVARLVKLTWDELSALVDSAALRLIDEFNAAPSLPRRLGHRSDNGLADIVIALACMSLGAVEFPFDHRLGDAEIARRWNGIGGYWIDRSLRDELVSPRSAGRSSVCFEAQPADLDAPSLVLWTSGTTGVSRGVTLSSRNLAGNASAKLGAVPQSKSDRRLCVLPLTHAYARTCDFGTWLLSGCELAVTFGYFGLTRIAPEFQPTLINSVPSIADRMLQDVDLHGLDELRLLGCGGAALSEATFDRWRARGVTVIQGYGLTEASPVICSATPWDARAGLVGRFVEGWETQIRDQQLFVRGSHVMLGYWGDPEATARRIDHNGWLATGDLVEQDRESGQLRVLGRADDVIVLPSAKKIHPETVERSAAQINGVRHAMLTKLRTLQLWFDADNECDDQIVTRNLRALVDEMDAMRGCELHRFVPPLRQDLGELTAKGTICRKRILELRFPGHAGS